MAELKIESEFNKFFNNIKLCDDITQHDAKLFARHIADMAVVEERDACAKACKNISASIDNDCNRGLGVAGYMIDVANDCADQIMDRI